MNIVFLLFAASFFALAASHDHQQQPSGTGANPCTLESAFTNTVTLRFVGDVSLTLIYTVDCLADTIELNITTETAGWMGIGFNNVSHMSGADLYQMAVDAGSAKVVARNVYGVEHTVEANTSAPMNAIGEPRGSLVNNRLNVAFKRALAAQVPTQRTLSHDAPLYLLAARRQVDGNMNEAHAHALDGGFVVSAAVVQLFTTDAVDTGDSEEPLSTAEILIVAHAVVMAVAWAALGNVGIMVARHLKRRLGHRWYLIHRNIMLVVVLLTLLGLAMAVAHVQLADGMHFKLRVSEGINPHSSLGLVVSIGAIVQVAVGFVSNRLFRAGRLRAPCVPDRVHWWFGRMLLLTSLVNMLLGMWLWTGRPFSAATALIVLIMLATTVIQTRKAAPFGRQTNEYSSLENEETTME
jgi:hypothetical protein